MLSFAFNTTEIQQGYFEEATDIIREMLNKKLPKERIWCNVVYTVDGADGQAMTNEQLGKAISRG